MTGFLRIAMAAIPGLPSLNGVLVALVMGGAVTTYFWHTGKVAEAGRVGERKGENRIIQKVQKNNAEAPKIGRSAAAKSGKPAPRSVSCPVGYRC